MPIYMNKNLLLVSNLKSDKEFAKHYKIKEYSIIEGCIRQSTDNPIKKSMETKKEKSTMETFYDCTEDIAKVLEKYYPEIYVEDMDRINILVQEELAEANRRQARENLADQVNGGSR